jgi:hypothetical protein
MVTRIYIDECGYTGDDLFNLDQPIFCLASTSLPEETCQELKSTYFGKVKANELKHSQLSTRPSQQKMIIDFLHSFEQINDTVKFSIAHKHFVLLTKIVNLIVEPIFYDDDEDFYKDGDNISYSNLLYYSLHFIMGEEFLLKVLSNFQVMIRERTIPTFRTPHV